MKRAPLVLLAAFLALGCDRKAAEPPPRENPKATAKKVESNTRKADDKQEWRFHFADRVVAVGDLHGDLEATRAALRLAGATNAEDDWIGGKLVVVQTGDQLDRGDDEREILELLNRLQRDAHAAGGALHVLNGNHETMNVAGDFRYVTPGGLSDFYSETGKNPRALRLPAPARGRAHAFMPGGKYADMLAKRNTIIIVGDTAFVHGGILPKHVDYGIAHINTEVRAWMRGKTTDPPKIIMGDDAPVWTRRYSSPQPTTQDCNLLKQTLSKLKIVRMVVGHTVQKDGITSACQDKIWRIDVGLAKHYGGEKIQALEIHQGRASVLTVKRGDVLTVKRGEEPAPKKSPAVAR